MLVRFVQYLAYCMILLGLCVSSVSAQEFGTGERWTFFSNNHAMSFTTDFDETDDSRNFTSEAVFAESESRLDRSLTRSELREISRVKEAVESFNIFRLRVDHHSFVDISYKKRTIDNAQITSFFDPGESSDVELDEFGFSLQKEWVSEESATVFRGAYRQANRRGLIEFFPEADDTVDTYELNLASVIHVGESSELSVFPTYVIQDIDLDITNSFERDRRIFALSFTHGDRQRKSGNASGHSMHVNEPLISSALEHVFERRFDYRASRYYGGIVSDEEKFGETEVVKEDIFLGMTFFGKNRGLTIEPSLFTSSVSDDSNQDNAQYRTTVVINFYRLYERPLDVSVPLRHDVSVDGPDYYENWRIGLFGSYRFGLGVDSIPDTQIVGGVSYQEFLNIGESIYQWMIGLNIRI